MLSQNVAKSVVPSYYMIRTNLPHRKPMNQWQPVYYYSGITKREQRRILLRHKRLHEEEHVRFQDSVAAVASRLDSYKGTPEASTVAKSLPTASLVNLAASLYDHGLVHMASPITEQLHSQHQLSPFQYATLIRSLSASRVSLHVLRTTAQHDPALTFKLMEDRNAAERLSEAHRIFDMAHSKLNAIGARGVTAAHYNALMEVMLTCGFEHVKRISGTMYDELGVRSVAPTAHTYELVIQALALQGNTAEAQHVLDFIRNHHADEISIRMLNSMLLGHRENKTFDQCDLVWNELVDRRFPRANVLSAELYLRSIVDHSYTRSTDSMGLLGRIHTVEKKKIPIVLTQMDTLGIPRIHLSPPLLDEVEDGLRKFAIHKSRFYEWGRAVKQFDFIEFRRRQGWMYDLDEVSTATKMTPAMRDYSHPDAAVAAVSSAEAPSYFADKSPWLLTPLEDTLYVTQTKERMEDVRMGDIYYDDRRSIHERPTNWVSEVPQTRYDQLYGVTNPDIPKIGIRRHLHVEYSNKKEIMERDAALVKKTLSGARRIRRRSEIAPTHRVSADDAAPNDRSRKPV